MLIIVFSFILSNSGDTYSHIGGFLAGMCCGLFLSPVYQNPATANQVSLSQFSMRKEQKIMFGVGVACYVLMVGLIVLLM